MINNQLPNCENPQLIKTTTGYARYYEPIRGEIYRPCGHCYSCLGRRSQTKAGQLLGEVVTPIYDHWREPGWMHFFTLTYPDSCLPRTEPKVHDLALNWAQDGPFEGPFPQLPGKSKPKKIKEAGKVKIMEMDRGRYTGRQLSDGELAEYHFAYLTKFLKWPDSAVEAFKAGKYGSMGTLDVKHVQDFVKRLRSHFSRHYKDLPMFQYGYTGEYGDQFNRPHYHFILFGWPPWREALEYLYHAWQSYQDGAIVDPNRHEAVFQAKTYLDPLRGAAAYTAKDLAKGRRELCSTPAKAARAKPFVLQSKQPPIGQARMESWLEAQIAPVLDRAGGNEIDRCIAVRDVYTRHLLELDTKSEYFTTTDHWRSHVKRLFHPDEWEETTHRINAENAAMIERAEVDPKLKEKINDHFKAVAEKNQRNEERAKRRKRRKALRQSSSGL